MRFRSVSVGWLALLALACLNVAGAQVPPPSPPSAALPVDALAQTLPLELAQPFEQAWDVVELAGQPMLSDNQRPARVVLRPNGSLWVDGGCNYFSGRVERDAQGLFRVSKYGSTQRVCEKPPRSEAFLNSALMMVDNFRWDRGLLLRSGSSELLRLRPSANQDTQALEQGLGRRALPAVATAAALAPAAAAAAALQPARERPVAMQAASARQVASQDCRPVKARKGADKSRKAKAPVCQPLQAKAVKTAAGKASLRAAGAKSSKAVKSSAKSSKARQAKAGPAAKNRAKSSGKKNTQVAQKRTQS